MLPKKPKIKDFAKIKRDAVHFARAERDYYKSIAERAIAELKIAQDRMKQYLADIDKALAEIQASEDES